MEPEQSITPTNVFIGARLRQARLMRRISQTDLGKGLKKAITFQQVQKYENATNRISVEMLEEFAAILKLPITFFLPGQDIEFEPVLTPPEAELLEFFHKMNTQSQKALITLLKGVRGAES